MTDPSKSINKRDEFISKCRHTNKFILGNLKSDHQVDILAHTVVRYVSQEKDLCKPCHVNLKTLTATDVKKHTTKKNTNQPKIPSSDVKDLPRPMPQSHLPTQNILPPNTDNEQLTSIRTSKRNRIPTSQMSRNNMFDWN